MMLRLQLLPPGSAAAVGPTPGAVPAAAAATGDDCVVHRVGVEQVRALKVVNEEGHVLEVPPALNLVQHLQILSSSLLSSPE